MKKILINVVFVFLFALLLNVPVAGAVSLDLSAVNASGAINDALFTRTSLLGQGSGNFDPFVRIQSNESPESGYNTDGEEEFDTKVGVWTHSLLLTDLPLVNISGVDYREILLDAGEPGPAGGANNALSLSKLEIYLLGNGSVTGYPANFPQSALQYSFVGGQYDSILLNNITGNGEADMFAYIPESKFTSQDQFLYLYSQFYENGGTYEEWGVKGQGNSAVPEPASMMLLGSGLFGLLGLRKKQ